MYAYSRIYLLHSKLARQIGDRFLTVGPETFTFRPFRYSGAVRPREYHGIPRPAHQACHNLDQNTSRKAGADLDHCSFLGSVHTGAKPKITVFR